MVTVTDIFSVDPTTPSGVQLRVRPGWPSLSEISGQPETPPSRVRLGNVDVPAVFQMDITQAEPEVWLVSLLFQADAVTNAITLPLVIALNNDVDAGLRWVKEMKSIADWKSVALMHLTFSSFESTILKPAGLNIEDLAPDDHDLLRKFDEMISSLGAVSTTRRRRNSVNDDLLKEVAQVYRAAMPAGAPTEAVRQHFYVSHSSATRYVRLAREASHLGRSNGSRGGEVSGDA